MNDKVLEEINRRLGVIIALLSQRDSVPQNKLSLREQIKALDSYGLHPKEIARILNKTPNHVHKELTLIRQGK